MKFIINKYRKFNSINYFAKFKKKRYFNSNSIINKDIDILSKNYDSKTDTFPILKQSEGGNRLLIRETCPSIHLKKLQALLDDIFLKSNIENLNLSTFNKFSENTVLQGHHLVLFNPAFPEECLSSDGYHSGFTPDEFDKELKTRMWYSGELIFYQNSDKKYLITDKPSLCVEEVDSIKKITRNSNTSNKNNEENNNNTKKIMRVNVKIKRNMYSLNDLKSIPTVDDTPVIQEYRELIYLPSMTNIIRRRLFNHHKPINITNLKTKYLNNLESNNSNEYLTEFILSDISLFRFSALSYNAHKIHWDTNFAKSSTEGFRSLVVQGPLLILLIIEWLNKYIIPNTLFSPKKNDNININTYKEGYLKRIKYNNVLPAYVNEKIIIRAIVNPSSYASFENKILINLYNEQGYLLVNATAYF